MTGFGVVVHCRPREEKIYKNVNLGVKTDGNLAEKISSGGIVYRAVLKLRTE